MTFRTNRTIGKTNVSINRIFQYYGSNDIKMLELCNKLWQHFSDHIAFVFRPKICPLTWSCQVISARQCTAGMNDSQHTKEVLSPLDFPDWSGQDTALQKIRAPGFQSCLWQQSWKNAGVRSSLCFCGCRRIVSNLLKVNNAIPAGHATACCFSSFSRG